MVDNPKVLNLRHLYKIPRNAVRVDRTTKWGNPYKLGKGITRQKVLKKYRRWITNNDELMCCLDELRGKDLCCWCAPKACHADILLELANKGVKSDD